MGRNERKDRLVVGLLVEGTTFRWIVQRMMLGKEKKKIKGSQLGKKAIIGRTRLRKRIWILIEGLQGDELKRECEITSRVMNNLGFKVFGYEGNFPKGDN